MAFSILYNVSIIKVQVSRFEEIKVQAFYALSGCQSWGRSSSPEVSSAQESDVIIYFIDQSFHACSS